MKNQEINPSMRETSLYPGVKDTQRPLTADEQKTTMRKHDKKPLDLEKGTNLNVKKQNNKIETLSFPKKDLKVKKVNKIKNKVSRPKKIKFSNNLSRLERYAQYDRHNVDNQRFPALEEFKGPVAKRTSTNPYCILVPLIFLAWMIFHSAFSFVKGWPTDLVKPRDIRGMICGEGELKSKEFLYFLAPTIDPNVAICVDECPSTTGQKICIYDGKNSTLLTTFCYTQISTDTSGKYCYPQETEPREIIDEFLSAIEPTIRRMIGDLFLSWDIILLVFIIILFIAFGVTTMLRKSKGIKLAVWGCLGLTIIILEVLGYYAWMERKKIISLRCLFGENRHNCGGTSANTYMWIAIVFWSLGGAYMIWMGFMFNKVNLCIGILRSALPVTRRLQELKYLPIYSVFIMINLVTLFMFTIMFSFSVVNKSFVDAQQIDGNTVIKFLPDYSWAYFLPINIICISFFTIYTVSWSEFMNTYAYCIWFFSTKKETVSMDAKRVFKESLRYHMGFITYLSLNKLIFAPLRSITSTVYETLEGGKQSRLINRFFQACCFPFIWLHYRFLRYISKISFIQLSMWSTPYKKASKQSYFLVKVRNFDRGIGNDKLISFVLFQIKISIGLMSALMVHLYQQNMKKTPLFRDQGKIESFLTAPVLAFLFTIPFVSSFTAGIEMAILSMYHCNFIDEEMHVGEQRFAGKDTSNLMGYYSSKFKANALDAGAKGKKADVGEYMAAEEMYEEVRSDEDQYTPPVSSDESEGLDDDFDETKKKRVVNKFRDFLMENVEENKTENRLQKDNQKVTTNVRVQRKDNNRKVLGNEHGPVDADFDAYMAQNMSEPEMEESTKPFKMNNPPAQPQESDDLFNLGNVELTQSQHIQNKPHPRDPPTVNLIDPNNRKVPQLQDYMTQNKPQIADPNDPYNMNQYKHNNNPSNTMGQQAYPDDNRSRKSKAKSSRSRKSKSRAKDLLADVGLDGRSHRSKHSKRSRKHVLGEDDNLDFLGDNKSHKSHKKSKHRDLGLDELGIDDRKSHKSKKSKHRGFYDDLGFNQNSQRYPQQAPPGVTPNQLLPDSQRMDGRAKSHKSRKSHKSHKSHKSKKSKANDLMDKLMAGPVASRRRKEQSDNKPDDFFTEMESVVDKDPGSIMIMNASKGSFSIGGKKKKTNESTFRLQAYHESDEDDDQNKFF